MRTVQESGQTVVARSSERARVRRRAAQRESLVGYLFILPSIIGFSVFVAYPMICAAYYALTDWDGIKTPRFIGLENFRYLFLQDPIFWRSFQATLLYVLLNVPLSLALGLLLAMLLNRTIFGIKLFRTIFYLPTVLPIVAALTLWKFIFNPQFGLANALLTKLHLPTSLWLGSEVAALPTLVVIGLWGVGATMIIFLAGLQAVPTDLYEAAAIDGAGWWRLFFNITLPMLSPILFLQLVMLIIASLQAFVQPKLLTQGGPNNATNFLMHKIYSNGFGDLSHFPQLGYATAQVWVLFVLIMAVTLLTFRFSTIWVFTEHTDD